MTKKLNKSDSLKVTTLYDRALRDSEEAKPSSDPVYWAKKSCNKCYGRGIIGGIRVLIDTNTLVNEQLCSCARARFMKWRDDWVTNYILSIDNSK